MTLFSGCLCTVSALSRGSLVPALNVTVTPFGMRTLSQFGVLKHGELVILVEMLHENTCLVLSRLGVHSMFSINLTSL